MAITNQHLSEEYQPSSEEDYSEDEESESEYDSGDDPSYDVLEDSQSSLAELSIKTKGKSRPSEDSDSSDEAEAMHVEVNIPDLNEKDQKSLEAVHELIEAGKLEKLKVDQCKVYLRKYGLRLTGNKDALLQRIKEHLEIVNGGGEKKYPPSSFVVNCKGDACFGDVVIFQQNVYDQFSIVSRSASGPPCGKRIVAGRIIKESYGAAKQQHTFTIEVLWSRGEKPLPPLHPLLIKGRNLYRFNTMRQRWEDEGARQKALMEKHSRGSLARTDREARVQEKEQRKALRKERKKASQPNKLAGKEKPKKNQASSSRTDISYCHGRTDLPQPSRFHGIGVSTPFPQQQLILNGAGKMVGGRYNDPVFSSMPNTMRPPLANVNNQAKQQPPLRGTKQQICRHFEQGRCYFGDNCKFLHEYRKEAVQYRR